MEYWKNNWFTQEKAEKEGQTNIIQMDQIENKCQDGRLKPNHIDNYFKCKWL